jgi:acyl transferase domain-containing protein
VPEYSAHLPMMVIAEMLGVPVDWRAANQSPGPVVDLPSYPWTRESFWLESREFAEGRGLSALRRAVRRQ